MSRPRKTPTHKVDWILRATRPDYELSSDSPIFAMVSRHAQPTSLRIDIHAGIEVGIMLRGRQHRQYPGWTTDLRAGDVWLQPMWEPHAWRAAVPNTHSVVLVFLPNFLGEERVADQSWLSLFAAPPERRPRVTDKQTQASALAIARELVREIEGRDRGWLTALRIGILRILFLVGRHWSAPSDSHDISRVNASNLPRLMPAISLIQESSTATCRLEDAAAACGMSRSRFVMLFRETMGTTFARFALRARLGFAAHRLITTSLPIEAIATQAGFVDASHFHRMFVKHYRRTPRQYRRTAD